MNTHCGGSTAESESCCPGPLGKYVDFHGISSQVYCDAKLQSKHTILFCHGSRHWKPGISAHERVVTSQQSKHTVPVQIVRICHLQCTYYTPHCWGGRGRAGAGGGGVVEWLGYLQAVDDMLCVKVRILQPLLECINKHLHRV